MLGQVLALMQLDDSPQLTRLRSMAVGLFGKLEDGALNEAAPDLGPLGPYLMAR
jgi:hypothetical protein